MLLLRLLRKDFARYTFLVYFYATTAHIGSRSKVPVFINLVCRYFRTAWPKGCGLWMLPACGKACSHRRQHIDIKKPRAGFEFIIPVLKRQDVTIFSLLIFWKLIRAYSQETARNCVSCHVQQRNQWLS